VHFGSLSTVLSELSGETSALAVMLSSWDDRLVQRLFTLPQGRARWEIGTWDLPALRYARRGRTSIATLGDQERGQLESWRQHVWHRTEAPPRWEKQGLGPDSGKSPVAAWAVVARQEDHMRIMEGAGEVPAELQPLFDGVKSSIQTWSTTHGTSELFVRAAYFGRIEVPEEGIVLRDGGTHGNAGHELIIDGTSCRWMRSSDGLYPSPTGEGALELTAEERSWLDGWADAVWSSFGEARVRDEFDRQAPEPPRWVWTIALRRGDNIRLIEGDTMPPLVSPALKWLKDRVDGLCGVG
jgi:hypothetical protein